MSIQRKHWGIVGGGFLGMTLAYRLAQQGHEVTLYESAPALGGLASTWRLGDITWDKHYHVILMSDLKLRALLTELGLDDELQWVETKTGFYTDGRLYSMSNSLEFLQFPPLRLQDKVRLASTILYASKIKDWKRLERIPVAQWLRRWSGRHTFEKIWLPLLRAKLGENYTKASAAFIWAIIARMYAARRSGLKKEMFGYVEGGYARILEAFGEKLKAQGVRLCLGHQVVEVQQSEGGLTLTCTDATGQPHTHKLDQCVVTTAAPIASRLCPSLNPQEHQQLQGIAYQGIVCASVLLKRPLAGYYVTNITDDWVPYTAVIEMSALVDPAQFQGHHLVYLPKYVDPADPLLQASDAHIQAQFLGALKRMYPYLADDDVLSFQVSRVKYVLAIATLNYSDRLFETTTSVPGLHIINSAHILNGTLNVNETVQLAEDASLRLLASP